VPYPPCTVTISRLKNQDSARCLRRVTQPPFIAGPLAATLFHDKTLKILNNMTQSEIINLFVNDLRISLTEINYGLHYWYNTTHAIPTGRRQYETLRRYLERYHERVFCYELYHKLRTKMESHFDDSKRNIYSFRNIYLQSELRKDMIHNYIERTFNVVRLSREFMPDFLLHTPGNFDNQLIVMEVKSNPNVTINEIKYDLGKIQEFINNYQYLQGVFIAINISDETRDRILDSLSEWIQQQITTPEKIKLIFKSEPTSEILESDLNGIF
jgi:hypothetical protein